ncbi:MAG TPA: hypothetical protein VE010_14705, partial [Thermoanaerobaculia bacterium]|nr:hypothetical protein [Thermoanaerobaculia bacterium]
LDSATPDASHLTLGFSLDGENSQHTLEIALPKFYPSGINLFDHIRQQPGFANVPAGRHTISLWAIVRGGGTVEARFRQVEAIAFDATDDRLTPMLETAETEPLVVTPRGDGTVVFNQWLTEARCGNWTKLLEYDYPVTPLRNANSVGEAYVEFLGSASGEPQFVQVAIEVLNDPVFDADGDPIARQLDTDFSILEFMIPPGRSQKFLFTHALWWGTHRPNHIRLLARAMTCFGQPATDFRVGKRHMAIKMIPTSGTTSCQYD